MSSSYNNKHFTINNLRLLAGCLGFPRDIVQSKVPSHVIRNQSISLKDLCYYAEEGFFTQKLHLTCNTKTGNYNSKVFIKSALLLSENILSIEEIRDIRMIFEAFEEFDQRGMLINQGNKILKTLKIAGWVVAPEKLVKKLRHVKMSYDEKERIQLYEFFDLIPLCEKLPISLKRVHKHLGDEKTKRNVYMIDELKDILKTEDERMYEYLNSCYEKQQLPSEYPLFASEADCNPALNLNCFEVQLKKSAESQTIIKSEVQKNENNLKILKNNTSFGSNINIRKVSKNLSENTSTIFFEKEKRSTKSKKRLTKKNDKNRIHFAEKNLNKKSTRPLQITKTYKKVDRTREKVVSSDNYKLLDGMKNSNDDAQYYSIKNPTSSNVKNEEKMNACSMDSANLKIQIKPHINFKKDSKNELRAVSRRNKVLDINRKDQGTQTTENTMFDTYLSQEFSIEDCQNEKQNNFANSKSLEKELGYRKKLNKVVKRLLDSQEISCKKQTNKFIYQKSDMFVANMKSLKMS